MTSAPEMTFGFVDLAGFTAMTEAHGDEQAAEMAGRFTTLVRDELRTGEDLVKCIGDAVMLRTDEPAAGVALVGRICGRADAEAAFPALRAGLHHGPAVARDGDWFGATVNVAARVAAEAGGGQVLATAEVARPAQAAGVPVRALGPRRLRHVAAAVELFEITPCAALPDRVIDPVCHMAVERSTAPGRLAHGGHDHWFCSLACAGAFAADPDRFDDQLTGG